MASESDELVYKIGSYRCLGDGFIKTGAKQSQIAVNSKKQGQCGLFNYK